MKLNKDKLKGIVSYRHSVEHDSMPFRGNCSAIDPETDSETERWIQGQLDSGNIAAWCVVVVSASALGVDGYDSRCGCSYESMEALEKDLLPEMKKNAFHDLYCQLQEQIDKISFICD
jgi:hypothetical protein